MSDKEAVGKLIGILERYKRTIVALIMCLLISTILSFYIPLLSKHIMDDGFIGGDKVLLIKLVLLSAAIYIISSLIDIIKEKKRIEICGEIQYSLTEESFLHLMKLNMNHFNKMNNTEILNNLSVDIQNISSIADNNVFFVLTKLFGMVGGTIGLFIIDYRLTMMVLLFIPMKYFVMKLLAKKNKAIIDEFIKCNDTYAEWFGDCIGGVREVKLFGLLDHKHNEFKEKQESVIKKYKHMNMLGQWNNIINTIMIKMLISAIYLVGTELVFDMELSVGSVFAFITYSIYVTDPIASILNIGYLLSGIIPSTKRYYKFMNLKEEEYIKEGKVKAEPGDIRLRDVCFSYDNIVPTLQHINLLIPEGSKTAVIGKNGCGKSTLIKLLTRLWSPQQGKIMLGGKDIADFSIADYREMIAIVSQDIYLFNDTIRNNICLYKKVDEEEIKKACYDSGLEEFLNDFSLDYVVGHNGTMLSGGQKQKIALARALILDRPIVILDEATSNTDVYSEMQIKRLLHTRLKDKTVIIISHKRDILKDVDNIILLVKGTAAGKGTYEELYRENVYFREMVEYAEEEQLV